jgi:hypothetical protein
VAARKRYSPKKPRKLFVKPADEDVAEDDILETPEPKAKAEKPADKKGISEDDFQALVRNMALDARNYITEEVADSARDGDRLLQRPAPRRRQRRRRRRPLAKPS